MKTAAVYARVSSTLQDIENSIQAQVRACREYAQKHEYSIFNIYIDEARSGRNENRPGFQQMIKDAKGKKFQIILADKLDRFSRDVIDTAVNIKLLKDLGIEICFVSQLGSIDTPIMEMVSNIMAAINKFYVDNMVTEIKKGQKQAIISGYLGHGCIPYGYTSVWEGDKRKLVIDPETGPVVKKLFEMSASGCAMKDLLTFINSSSLKPKQAPRWGRRLLRILLDSEYVMGVRKYDDTRVENAHPPIISKELFEQSRLQRKRWRGVRNPEHRVYILVGVATCDRCGGRITSKSTDRGKYKYYLCDYAIDKVVLDTGACITKHVLADTVEEKVKEIVLEKLQDYNLNKALSGKTVKQDDRKVIDEKSLLKKELKDIEVQKQNIINAIVSGINPVHFKQKLDELGERKKQIENELKTKKKASEKILHPQSLAELIQKASPLQLRNIYKEQVTVKLNLVERTGRLQIKYFYPEDCWFDFSY